MRPTRSRLTMAERCMRTKQAGSSRASTAAMGCCLLANINRPLRIALRPPELREFQDLEIPASRARHEVPASIALFIRHLDPAHAGDLGRRAKEYLPPGERPRAGHRQRDR